MLARRGRLVALAVALPLLLDAAPDAAPDARVAARIAYVNSGVCGGDGSTIATADVAGQDREVITTRERCRPYDPNRLMRYDEGPAWAPDGRSLAYLRSTRRRGVYVWTRGQGTRRIDRALVDLAPAWSPDGHRLALAYRGALWITSRRGGRRRPLRRGDPSVTPIQVEWSPDGSRLLYITDGDLRVVPASRGKVRLLARDVQDSRDLHAAAWSPDGRRIAYAGRCVALPGESHQCILYVASASGGKPRRFNVVARDMSLGWDREGRHVLVGTTDVGHGLQILDVRTGRSRTAMRDWVTLEATAGSRAGDLRLATIVTPADTNRKPKTSLALITAAGRIKTKITVPRGWGDMGVAAYVR